MNSDKLSEEKQIEYLCEHIPYRLEWLCTVVDRNHSINDFEQKNKEVLRGITNCALNMAAVGGRVLLEFLGLTGKVNERLEYTLKDFYERRGKSPRKSISRDILPDWLYGRWAEKAKDVPSADEQELLAMIYEAGNKSIAHFTTDKRPMDWWEKIHPAAPIIKRLLKECIYDELKKNNPALYRKVQAKIQKGKYPDSLFLVRLQTIE